MIAVTDHSFVSKRHVFYLSGFDPRGASFYHRLYQEESRKQADLLGAEIKVGKRTHSQAYRNDWTVDAVWRNLQDVEQSVHTDYCFLIWDDIVRQHWERSLPKLIIKSIPSYIGYIRSGAFKTISQDYRGPFFSALYPVIFLIILLMISVVLGVNSSNLSSTAVNTTLSFLVGFSMFIASFAAGLIMANKLGVFWLLRTYLFVYELGLHDSSIISSRVHHFVEVIKAKQKHEPADEILIIGHSVGSIVAVHLMALMVNKYPYLSSKVKLVTLGQCVPLQSGMKQAKLLNTHLSLLKNQLAVHWSDFVARADSLAFVKTRPLETDSNFHAVKIIRFFNAFHPKTYKIIKKNKLKLHFQYLMASEIIGDYDYFKLTAGVLPLSNNDKGARHAL